jgi:hypothetical protein
MNSVSPVLMRDNEVISSKETVFRSGTNEKTVRRQRIGDGIGRRSSPAAALGTSALTLETKRYGNTATIDDLRRGNFATLTVRRYAEHLGLD